MNEKKTCEWCGEVLTLNGHYLVCQCDDQVPEKVNNKLNINYAKRGAKSKKTAGYVKKGALQR